MEKKSVIDRPTLYGFIAILLWSSTIALVRSISERIGPLTAGAAVYIIGGIISICYLNNSISLNNQSLNYFLNLSQ